MKMKGHLLLFLSLEKAVGTGPEQAKEGAGHLFVSSGKQRKATKALSGGWAGGRDIEDKMSLGPLATLIDATSEARPGAGKRCFMDIRKWVSMFVSYCKSKITRRENPENALKCKEEKKPTPNIVVPSFHSWKGSSFLQILSKIMIKKMAAWYFLVGTDHT